MQKMLKSVAFLFFASCLLNAFCLGMLAFTFATGDLPFNIVPMMCGQEKHELAEKHQIEKERIRDSSEGERLALRLYREMKDERQKFTERREELAEQERVIEELTRNSRELQKKLGASETEINLLLSRVNEKEKQNAKLLGDVLTNSDTASSAQMLLDMEKGLAARVLYFMDSRTSGKIISEILKSDTGGGSERAVSLLESLYRLSEEMNNESLL